MEQVVKQRLVGAAVLTALAVITLPMIFDVERQPAVQVPETVPPRPEWPAIATAEPQPVPRPAEAPETPVPVGEMYQLAGDEQAVPADVPAAVPPEQPSTADSAAVTGSAATSGATTSAAAASEAVPAVPALEPPAVDGKLDARGVPEGWVVQVAAMSDAGKAETLLAKLKLAGHPAFKTVSHGDKGDTIRVLVGPKLDKAQAQRLKQQLDRELGEQTMLKPFAPK